MRRILDVSFVNRTPFAIIICILLMLPFFLVTIPPLIDLPGHMGGSAAAAYSDDPAFARLLGFHWYLVPNLGTDLIVAGLRHMLGITRAYWVAAAIIPPLLAAGLFMVARALNPRGAMAVSWALIFVYSYPLTYGFLNYMLGVAFSLIGFATWILLDRRPRFREWATWVFVPLLFLCHVVAGCLFVLFVGSREFDLQRRGGQPDTLLRRIRPLLSSIIIILAWRLSAHSFVGRNRFSIRLKIDAIVMLLRDQNLLLDIGSLFLALIVFVVGWRKGARPHHAVVPALLFLILLFLVLPPSLGGSSYADERLLPLIPMLAFATQDWSRLDRRLVQLVALSGLGLLVMRLSFTLAGFTAYDARFSAELAALQHVSEHSRIIVLNTRDCDARHFWRADRLDHLGELATVYRRSWTNSEWDVDGAHLLQILYRPSPRFYDDPSQYVWPANCGGVARRQPTMEDALSAVPFNRIDYLWLIDAALPAGYHNPQLTVQWQHGRSALYSVLPASQVLR